MNFKKRITYLFINVLFISINHLFAQIDELKYKEVQLSDFDKKYQEKFYPYRDSSFFKNPRTYLDYGYVQLFKGNDEVGNYFMNFALEHYTEKNAELFHMLSVQNTKNGNYNLAITYLDSAVSYSKETYGYYGWVMLYYFHDYEKTIDYLTIYDSLTPGFSDFPMGENIYYLKGLAFMQLKKYKEAISCFNTYIDEETKRIGKKWVECSTFYYKGICLEQINNFKSARKNYKIAIQLNNKFLEAIYRKALLSNKKKKSNLKYVKELIQQGYSKTDVYVEIFHPVYLQEVEENLLLLK